MGRWDCLLRRGWGWWWGRVWRIPGGGGGFGWRGWEGGIWGRRRRFTGGWGSEESRAKACQCLVEGERSSRGPSTARPGAQKNERKRNPGRSGRDDIKRNAQALGDEDGHG